MIDTELGVASRWNDWTRVIAAVDVAGKGGGSDGRVAGFANGNG